MKSLRAACFLGFFILHASFCLHAQTTTFTYQGRVQDNGTNYTGTGQFLFALVTTSAGTTTTLWSNDGTTGAGKFPTATLSLGVTNGLFTITLGSLSVPGMAVLPAAVFGQPGVQLEIWFSDGVNGTNAFPLQTLTPAPYAVVAGSISGSLSLAQLPASVLTNGENGTLAQVVDASTSFTAQSNTAYDLTNSTETSVTLPASANVGDVIQVTGSGTGGWQVTANAMVPWTEQPGAPTSGDWYAFASSADGIHLVAVVQNGGIYTSANSGATWTEQTSAPTSAVWYAVASSADGTHLVAVVYSGGIYTSANSGATWTEQLGAPTSAVWSGVASSADGTHLVAVADSGGIYTSADSGVTWTEQTSAPTSATWHGVASSADGTHLVAGQVPGGIYTSANSGVTWTEQPGAPTSAAWEGLASSADGTHLVAVAGGGGIYTSANSGVTWTEQPGAPTSIQWSGVASSADGTHLAAVVYGGGIYTSANSGVTWSAQPSAPTSTIWFGVASSADGTHLVAGVYGGGIYTSLNSITGAAGTSEQFQCLGNGLWQPLPPTAGYLANNGSTVVSASNGSALTNVPGTLAQVVAAGTRFTAQANTAYNLTNSSQVSVTLPASANVGDIIQVTGAGAGGWQVTENAIVSWLEQTSVPTKAGWQAVASSADGTHLVAAVYGGGIYTSTNSGVTWTVPASAPTAPKGQAVASSADGTHLVAATFDGGIYTSANSGVTWTEQSSAPTSAGWQSVASSADGTHLVAVVFGGGIYTSANSGMTWTEQMSAPTSDVWEGAASSADGTHLVAVAYGGGIYTSTNSGVIWTAQPSAPASAGWVSVASSADGTHLVALASGGGIYTSANSGVTWTAQTSAPTSVNWQSVASSADGTHLVAVVFEGGIYTSANSGVTWTEQTSAPTSAEWIGIASSADGTHLVTVVDGGGIYCSLNGITGAAGTSEQFQYLGNGLWQPLPPTAGYLANNGSTVLSPGNVSGLTGTIADSLLSANVALRAGGNAFTGNQTITGGSLGIGLTSPTYPLEVATNGVAIMTLDTNGNLECSGTVFSKGLALTSDRNAKENFTPVDNQAVLAQVATLPVTKWNYKTDQAGVQHIGPMAQDFQAAFGLDGPDDKHISVVDEGGVALAAIQGLNQKLQEQMREKDAEIAQLQAKAGQVDALQKQLNELAAALKALAAKH